MSNEEKLNFEIKNLIAKFYSTDEEKLDIFNRCQKYASMVVDWNNIHNIVSRKFEYKDILENICDSIFSALFFSEYFVDDKKCKKIIDVGSGGGVPGIPLAILFPQKEFILIDSNRKKCSFLRLVKSELLMRNVVIICDKFGEKFSEELVITKAAISPTHSQIIFSGLTNGGQVIIWATSKVKQEYVKEIGKVSGRLSNEQKIILPSGKETVFLVFTKEAKT